MLTNHMSLLSLAYFMALTPALLLAAILFKRSGYQQPGQILACLVLLMAYKLFEGALLYSGLYQQLPHAMDWLPGVALFLGPVFFAYVSRMAGHEIWTWQRWLLHLSPALLLLAFNAPTWFVPATQKVQMYHAILANPNVGQLPWQVMVLLITIKVHLGMYLAHGWLLLRQGEQAARNQTTDSTSLCIQWLSRLCLLLFALEALWVGLFLAHQLFGLTTLDEVSQAWLLLMSGVILLMGYWGLQHPDHILAPWAESNNTAESLRLTGSQVINHGRPQIHSVAKLTPDSETTVKYENSPLDPDTAQALAQAIQQALTQEHLHLRADLNLTDLSAHLGIRKHLISQVINQTLNTTFFKLINARRVKHAQALLKDEKTGFTLERIAQESGFNNRDTFNTAFKSEMGCSPSVYRKQMALTG